HAPRGGVGERKTFEQLLRDGAGVLQVPQPGDQGEVLSPGKNLVDGGELAGEADRLPDTAARRRHIVAVHGGRAGVGGYQGGKDPHRGRLAGPVRAEQGEDAAPCHLEVDTTQHWQIVVRLLQTAHPDRGLLRDGGHGCLSCAAARSIASARRLRSLLLHWPAASLACGSRAKPTGSSPASSRAAVWSAAACSSRVSSASSIATRVSPLVRALKRIRDRSRASTAVR